MNNVTGKIIGAALEVHNAIGPGLLESAYQECLAHEFVLRGIPFARQMPLAVIYKGVKVDCSYRLDFLIEDVVLETKSVAGIDPIHVAQVILHETRKLEARTADQLQRRIADRGHSPHRIVTPSPPSPLW